jgi:polysaccharide export outer membrane protein
MGWGKSFGLALILMTASNCSSPIDGLQPLESASMSGYRLGPGDEVRIGVFGFDSMSNSYVVSDSGTISMPLLSTIEVKGKTPAEVEALIADLLRTKELAPSPSVTAQVQKYRPFFILGEVQQPGQYSYVPGMSVLTAVSVAGGYTFRANKNEVAITRGSGGQFKKGRAGQQTVVLPGDTIFVYEQSF